MFVLQVIQGPYKDQAIQISQDDKISIGRSGACTFRFTDTQMSGRHAKFTWDSDGFAVADLGSSNGTQVNGERIRHQTSLRLGDHIQTGNTIFQLRELDLEAEGLDLMAAVDPGAGGMLAFDDQNTEMVQRGMVLSGIAMPQVSTPPPVTQAKILGLGPIKTTMFKAVTSAVIDGEVMSETSNLKLEVQSGAQGAKVVVKRDEHLDPFWALPVTIGREYASSIPLQDRSVSLRHAVIEVRDGRYLIRDDGSSNGVYVNKRRVVEHFLADGDVITIGAYILIVVLGDACLGLNVQAPQIQDRSHSTQGPRSSLGMLSSEESSKKKKKKKASELVWYATSDLDRGVFRFRAALMALVLGTGLVVWMLASGDSQMLAGNQLSRHHEDTTFVEQAEAFGRDRCTACHIGAGRIATLKCLDCHPDSRPTAGHVSEDLPCNGCHLDHLGTEYVSAPVAMVLCTECHGAPHQDMARVQPKLVVGFKIDAKADVDFHLAHETEQVFCLSCHDPVNHGPKGDIRGTCGGCHAPEDPVAQDCHLCHSAHPDQETPDFQMAVAQTNKPPRFALSGIGWSFGLLVLSFLVAAMLPRKRKVEVELPEERI